MTWPNDWARSRPAMARATAKVTARVMVKVTAMAKARWTCKSRAPAADAGACCCAADDSSGPPRPPIDVADAVCHLNAETFAAVAAGRATVQESLGRGQIVIAGPPAARPQVIHVLRTGGRAPPPIMRTKSRCSANQEL